MSEYVDNLVPFIEILTDDEKTVILSAARTHAGVNVGLNRLPFLSRKEVLEALYNETLDPLAHRVSDLARSAHQKLDVERWIDITAMGDTRRKELSTLTGEIRETDLEIINAYKP